MNWATLIFGALFVLIPVYLEANKKNGKPWVVLMIMLGFLWAGVEHDKWLKTATDEEIQDAAQTYYESQSDYDYD